MKALTGYHLCVRLIRFSPFYACTIFTEERPDEYPHWKTAAHGTWPNGENGAGALPDLYTGRFIYRLRAERWDGRAGAVRTSQNGYGAGLGIRRPFPSTGRP